MTDVEARRLLAEHRAVSPSFVRGRYRYTVSPDERFVSIERAIGDTGQRWSWESTVHADSYALPAEIRERFAGRTGA